MDGAQGHKWDPHRRTRRHHYQEGPGFLFLATQGGRPIVGKQPATLAYVRERVRAVRLAAEIGPAKTCAELGCSRPSLYRWIGAYRANGIAGLLDKSRRP